MAENAHKMIRDEEWPDVSSHDLRVYFVHTMFVKERLNLRVVMDVGSWDNYQSIKSYLEKSREANISREFERAGRE